MFGTVLFVIVAVILGSRAYRLMLSPERKIVLSHEKQEQIERFLLDNEPYYQKLSSEGRKKFLTQLVLFVQIKKWVPRDGIAIEEVMKWTIGAAAAKLCFGLRIQPLDVINRIHIFPAVFYHEMTRQHMKGGASRAGYLLLSWKNVEEGNADPIDNLNLALHEMAHVLHLDALHTERKSLHFFRHIRSWDRVAKVEMHRVRKDGDHYLRSYAGTNLHEFFAVCVEHFFETPEIFIQREPRLYFRLCLLLNQDPLSGSSDFELNRNRLRQAMPKRR